LHRLPPKGGEVDNRQPTVAEGYADSRIGPAGSVIRSSMTNCRRHPTDDLVGLVANSL